MAARKAAKKLKHLVSEKKAKEYQKICDNRSKQRIQMWSDILIRDLEDMEREQTTALAAVRLTRCFIQGVENSKVKHALQPDDKSRLERLMLK